MYPQCSGLQGTVITVQTLGREVEESNRDRFEWKSDISGLKLLAI